MPRWWRTPSWKRSTSRFRCWMRWLAGRSGRSAKSALSIWKLERRSLRPHPPIRSTRSTSALIFQDYLDPGYRTQPEYEENERPSFENFLSTADHAVRSSGMAAGSLTLELALEHIAEFVIGNLDEDGLPHGHRRRTRSGAVGVSGQQRAGTRRPLSSWCTML